MKQLREEFRQAASAACGNLPVLVRARGPLVHLLTNYVTVTDCVNAVLAIGGRAICSHASEEAAQVTSGADALVCNLGGTEYYDAMELSAAQAASSGIPLVIDPVGCAASEYRLNMCLHLTRAYHPTAIRGNYAEIAALTDGIFADEGGASSEKESAPQRTGSAGLDSTGTLSLAEVSLLASHMTAFARRYHTILIASGAVDLCTDGTRMIEVTGGTPALKRITGAGCLSTGVLAAFLAAFDAEYAGADVKKTRTDAWQTATGGSEDNSMPSKTASRIEAAAAAVRYVGLAGEYAQRAAFETGTGAGHFHMYLMDFLSASDPAFQ